MRVAQAVVGRHGRTTLDSTLVRARCVRDASHTV